MNNALCIEKLTVRPDRVVARVCVSLESLYTTPELATRMLAERPSLAVHACVNERGSCFGDVIQHTPLPHLLEHVVVDILAHTKIEDGKDCTFVGTSEWIDRSAGLAHVEVSYRDDLETLAAFKQAVVLINSFYNN